MEGLLPESAFASLVAGGAGFDHFTLIDVGCSGGIDPAWRCFGARLRAYGFDADAEECARLAEAETLAGARYVNAFVGPPPDHPFLARRAASPVPSRSVWYRLSGPRIMAQRASRARDLPGERRRALNLWRQTRLADPHAPLSLPAFLAGQSVNDADFIKIDVDGEDFAILNDIAGSLGRWNVLGLGLEVNFDGSEGDTEHSFHNTDRLMRAHGFDLFGLTIRRYSLAALPGIFAVDVPAETLTGRPQLGDAIYLRDLADPRHRDLAASLAPGKLLKLAAIASLAAVPDLAADLLLTHRDRVADLIDVPSALDRLAAQVQGDTDATLGYRDFMAAYEADSPLLYRPTRAAALAGPASVPAPAPEPRTDGDDLIRRLRAELDAMKRSTSWRLTAPLRALKRILRGTPAAAAAAADPISPASPPSADPPGMASPQPRYGALPETLRRLGYRPRGIVHAGAHFGEQMDIYLSLAPKRVVWIEADPDCVAALRKTVATVGGDAAPQTVIEALIAERDGDRRPFFRFSNAGESSSLFRATDLLRTTWPGLDETGEVLTLTTARLDTALRAHGCVPEAFDILVLDLQGAELLALQGAGEFLDAAEFLEIEVSSAPYYAGGALADEILTFLRERGFEPITPVHDHGDTVFRHSRRPETGARGPLQT